MQQSFQYFGQAHAGQLQQPEALQALQHAGETPRCCLPIVLASASAGVLLHPAPVTPNTANKSLCRAAVMLQQEFAGVIRA